MVEKRFTFPDLEQPLLVCIPVRQEIAFVLYGTVDAETRSKGLLLSVAVGGPVAYLVG